VVTSYSLLQIRQALAEEAFSGQFPVRINGTAAGSTTSVVIADLAYGASGATANAYHGCWLYNGAASPTAPFTSRVLEQAGFAPTTGTLTVAPPFGSAPGTNEVIFCYDLHPDELTRAINRVLRGLTYYGYVPVTLVPDGNMEGPDTQRWAQVGTVTLAKTAGGFIGDYILFGRQFLSVSAADSTEGVRSVDIPVQPNEPLLLSVPVQVDGNSVSVILYDGTNSANIKSVTVTERTPVEVRFTADVPATCRLVQTRFISNTTNASFMVGPVSLLSQNRRRFLLDFAQSALVTASGFNYIRDIQAVYSVPAGSAAQVADSYYAYDMPWRQIDADFEEDIRGESSAQNIVLGTYPGEPIYLMIKRRFPELTTTAATINAATNTTPADRDTIVQGAMYYLERARGRVVASNPQLAATHLGKAREHARRFAMMRQAQGYGIVAQEIPSARTSLAMT
jgi:hypothetical protein